MRRIGLVGILVAVVTVVGCATAPLRTDDPVAAIRAAEEVGAESVPRAALHLQLARESLTRATKLASDGYPDQAKSLLTRAEADAELAVLLSREDAHRREAQDAMERVRQLRQAHPERGTQ